MIHSQICITDGDNRFKYYVEYQDDTQYVGDIYSFQKTESEGLFARKGSTNLQRDGNSWNRLDPIEPIKELVNESSLNIYFPQFSVETYDISSCYIISAYTFINGIRIQLCSYEISRDDALAIPGNKKIKSTDYHEFINVKFPDPWYLCYSDMWKEWRDSLLSHYVTEEINNEGSLLYIELIPVDLQTGNNIETWSERPDYNSGSCSIPLSSNIDDTLHVDCKPIIKSKQGPTIDIKVSFNKEYNNDIVEYFKETYRWDVSALKTRFEIVMGDKNGIYNTWWSSDCGEREFPLEHIYTKSDLHIDNWNNWRPGLTLIGTYQLLDDDGYEQFSLMSKPYPMTMEIFKYFIKTEMHESDKLVEFLNLDYIDMQSYKVDVVNKINKQVIQVNKPDDYKANILKPIFVRSYELSSLKFHPKVTESVCIDLNTYRQKVKTFYLKLEDTEFVELGRTPSGVVFKIVGNNLPNKKPQGVFYILNEDHELVVTGNYIYEE